MKKVFVVDDDREWAGYYERLLGERFLVEKYYDGVAAMERMAEVVPDALVLDILLTGPTGFALLHEMQSYEDLARVPVVVVSSVTVREDLAGYGVVEVLDKGEMRPGELLAVIEKYCRPIRLQDDISINGKKSQDFLGMEAG